MGFVANNMKRWRMCMCVCVSVCLSESGVVTLPSPYAILLGKMMTNQWMEWVFPHVFQTKKQGGRFQDKLGIKAGTA